MLKIGLVGCLTTLAMGFIALVVIFIFLTGLAPVLNGTDSRGGLTYFLPDDVYITPEQGIYIFSFAILAVVALYLSQFIGKGKHKG